MRPHENKISIIEIFKQGVCGSQLQVLRPTIRTNGPIFRKQPTLWIVTQLLHSFQLLQGQKPSKRVDP